MKRITGGLQELTEDTRDFSRTAVFGTIRADKIPEHNFMVAPVMDIYDQGDSDACTAFATCAASSDQEGVLLAPEFSFYATKVLLQQDPNSWGANLRDAMKSHVKFGALDMEYSPFKLRDGEIISREEMLDPSNWENDHQMLAYEHRKNTFFNCLKDSPHDKFDSARIGLWLHREKMRSIVTGVTWRHSWTESKDGKISKEYEGGGVPHAFILKGQKYFDNEPYLVAQLSNGEDIGDKGLFYFPREVVNNEFKYGMFMFEDLPKEKVENHLYYGTTEKDNLLKKWAKITCKLIEDKVNI